MNRLLFFAVLFVGCFGLSLARAIAQPDPAKAFKFGDTNNDGKLSKDEFQKLVGQRPRFKDNPDLAQKLFDRLDTNKDGFLSLDEYRKMAELAKGPNAGKAPAPANSSAVAFNDKPNADQLAFFEKKIRPVLVDQCYKCHSAEAAKIKGGFLLDTRAGLRKGGDSGPAIVPGHPEKSALVRAIHYKDETTRMPPKAKLPDEVIADLEAWVKMGLPDPRDGASKTAQKEIDIEKGRSFWAFQKPQKATPPKVKDTVWARSDIDRFILGTLDAKGLKPVGDADRRVLLRRVYLDLTGLPPAPDDVEAFVADTSPTAFEKVVDRLLASPRFGERWGRHWLDVARYAETSGRTVNFNFPHAWRYRDYVIDSLNADKPYDQFIKKQLAGDLMPTSDPKLKAERTVATGFLAIGPKALNERIPLQYELDVADEQIDVTTQAFLGITAACARCHDHKFDPIPMKDYYALVGIFRSTETCYGTVRFIQSQRPSALIALPKESQAKSASEKLTPEERKRLQTQIETLEKRDVTDMQQRQLVRAQITLVQSRLDGYEADGMPKLQAMGVRERGRMIDCPVFTRGEIDKPGPAVHRGVLQVVSTNQPAIRTGSGRLELANWIANPNNPLTARVMVNRTWLHLFGRGLVPTPDNFGAAGQPPTHPALLDSLALSFTQDHWSVKKLIRRIVLSHAYQLDSRTDAKNEEVDPENALIWRMSPRRLDAEALRDSMLAVSGQLNLTPPVGSAMAQAGEGPSARPRLQTVNVQQAMNDPRNQSRSVYLPVMRDNLPEVLALFDAADPSMVVAKRPVTTVPSQSLFLLNSPFVLRTADAAAARLLKETTADSERVRVAYLSIFGRPPNEKEMQTADNFLKNYTAAITKDKVPPRRAQMDTWAAFCQALLASAEFQYRK